MSGIPFLVGVFNRRSKDVKSKAKLDDFIDRLHYCVTTYVLALCSVMIGSKQFFGNPIDCFIPAENSVAPGWTDYILSYCFIEGTYRMENLHRSSKYTNTFHSQSIYYYQWVPFFFAFQVFCFFLPNAFWQWAQSLLYVDMRMVITEASSLNNMTDLSDNENKINHIADYLYSYFQYRKIARRGCISYFLRSPSITCFFYALTKIMYLLNSIFQFFLVTKFLAFPDYKWGFELAQQYLSGIKIDDRAKNGYGVLLGSGTMPYFPVEVGCNYTTFGLTKDLLKHTAQCMIPVNYINEKLFFAIWFWLVFLSIVTLFSFVFFICSICNKTSRENSIESMITGRKDGEGSGWNGNRQDSQKFTHSLMGADGMLLLGMIKSKAGCLVCRHIVQRIWRKYCEEKGTFHRRNDKTDDSYSDCTSDYGDINKS